MNITELWNISPAFYLYPPQKALAVARILMRHHILILTFVFLCFLKATGQTNSLSQCPLVKLTVKLDKDTVKVDSDIRLTMTLKNYSKSVQSVWFDKPKSTTGGPAWTFVSLTDKMNGESVLKYGNKAILESQLYSQEQVEKFSYKLKPGQSISGQFSLYDLVVVKNSNYMLVEGTYEMQVTYCSSNSDKIIFTVE